MNFADKIIEMVQNGPEMSSADIAERLGCHPSYVRTALHRAGIFRGKHNPDVIYQRPSKAREQIEAAIKAERERVACYAEDVAQKYEDEIRAIKQVRTVPEPQLSKLKAQHWRILAKFVRDSGANGQQTTDCDK